MPEDIQDYLTNWFNQQGNHEFYSSAEEWVNSMTNWELLECIDNYNRDMREADVTKIDLKAAADQSFKAMKDDHAAGH